MSRARVHEVSSPISLFPFIGILLCTMGALLVVLVAVSRSARDSAEQQVHAQQTAVKATVDGGMRKKLADVQQYVGALASIRSDAERKLRDEHARLSHVEDHIRRLQEKMRSLQIAATELEALEKEHYDDRTQAERETARLNQLIDDSRKSIESLQEAADKEPASYALVPYEGPNGTFRRPIYVECVNEGVILQPEGVRIAADDLRPPIGAGNPLAAALRASRDHYVKLHPNEGKGRDTEPYPLLLVRSDGLYMFDRARQAIEAGDFDLGFELVEEDWKLKYPQPDPQLAGIEQIAVDQARARQEVLAAAAPRAYRGGSFSFNDRYGADDDDAGGNYAGGGYSDGGGYAGGGGDGEGSSGGNGGGLPSGGTGHGGSGHVGSGGGGGSRGDNSFASGESQTFGGGTSGGGSGSGELSGSVSGSPSGEYIGGGNVASGSGTRGNAIVGGGGPGGEASQTGAGGSEYAGGPGGGDPSGGNGGSSSGGAGGAGGSFSGSGGGGMPIAAMTDPNAPPDANGNPQSVSMMMGSPPPDGAPNSSFDSKGRRDKNHPIPPDKRGKDWAFRQKSQRAVAVRRTIRVVVRKDQLAILPDGAPNTSEVPAGRVVPFRGDTVQSLDEFVKQVHDQIDGWGIAGNGLYWRPVIVMTVGADGNQRANDLARLLKNSGLDLRTDETANNAPLGGTYETR